MAIERCVKTTLFASHRARDIDSDSNSNSNSDEFAVDCGTAWLSVRCFGWRGRLR